MANTKKKTSGKDLGIKIFLAVTAVILVVVICGSVLGSTGLLLRTSAPLSSANFKVDGAMLTYFYRTSYYSLVSSMGESISYFLDTTKSLKKQDFIDGTQTWHEYLLNSATAQAKEMLVLAEAAKAAGMSLDEADMELVDENMAALAESAKTYQYPSVDSFVATQYGEGLKAKDIRRAIELSVLASKYSSKMTADIVITDEEIESYFAEHEADYTYVDFRQYTFEAGAAAEAEATTDEQKNKMKADLRKLADELADCKTVEAFEEYLSNYMKKNAESTGGITDENLADNLNTTRYERYSSRDTDQGKWAFDASRKVGDTTVIEKTDSIGYTVLLLERAPYRVEDLSRNVRHILVRYDNHVDNAAARAIADNVLAEYEKSAKTEEDFAKLANDYSEDPGSNTNGGLYENVTQGSMVDEFDAWLFDDDRKVGDYGIIESESTGAHVMYYVGEGDPMWEISVRSTITQERYDAAYKALEESTEIKESQSALNRVD